MMIHCYSGPSDDMKSVGTAGPSNDMKSADPSHTIMNQHENSKISLLHEGNEEILSLPIIARTQSTASNDLLIISDMNMSDSLSPRKRSNSLSPDMKYKNLKTMK